MKLSCLVFCIGSSLVASFSFAVQDVGTQLGVRSRAMGGAGRAIANTNEAMYLNPAGMSQSARFSLDTDYVYRLNDPVHFVGLSLVDSTTNPLAAGLDFHLGIDPTQGTKSLSYLGSLALSFVLVEEAIFLGATGKYAFLPRTLGDPIQVNQFGVDAGILIKLPKGLSLAATGYNLVPTNSRRLPLSVGLGAGLNLRDDSRAAHDLISAMSGLTVAFDWLLHDFSAPTGMDHQLSAGMEYLFFEAMPLRVGYSYSLARMEHELSGGFGYVSNDFGLEGFYEQNITLLENRSFGIVMRLLF